MGQRNYDPKRDEYVDIDFHKLAIMTDKAFGVELEEGNKDLQWFPKSQIDNVRQLTEQCALPKEERTVQSLGVKRWLAEEEGLIDEE